MSHDVSPDRAEPDPTPAARPQRDPAYDRLAESADFTELKRRYLSFVVPATIGFLAWYLLFVVLSNWAPGFMGTQVIGNINLALVIGLLQFVTTFAIAYLYSRYSIKNLDPLKASLEQEYVDGRGGVR